MLTLKNEKVVVTLKIRQATVELVNDATCRNQYENVNNVQIGSTQICAGIGLTDTCQGDSGGPMLRWLFL